MPSLQQLKYLVALADSLSFSRAAAMTHVSQPTLSMQIKDLERRLNVVLFERSRSRVALTPLGEEIARKARGILAEVADIHALARTQGRGIGGTLRVGVGHTVGAYLLPLVIPTLSASFPDMRFYIREELPNVLLTHLDTARHDIVLSPMPIVRTDLQTLPLYEEPLMVVMPRHHALSSQEAIDRKDLKGETILTMEPGHRLAEQVSELCEEVGASLSYDYEGTSLDTIRQMVAMGMGISIMPALYVRSEVRREQLVISRPFRGAGPSRLIGLSYRAGNPRVATIQKVAEAIRGILDQTVAEVSVPELRHSISSPES